MQVRRAETVLFLGESHALSYAERVIERDDAPPLVCQPIFLAQAVALSNFTNDREQLNGQVRSALRSARLLVDEPGSPANGDGIFTARTGAWRFVAEMRYAVRPPMLVVCLGSYELFLALRDYPADDFVLPTTRLIHPLAPSLQRPLLLDHTNEHGATKYFTERVKPFQIGLQRLRERGFTRLAVISILPPTTDVPTLAHNVEALSGVVSPRVCPEFLYKAALILNALVAQACDAEGAQFLDAWPLLTRDGVARDDVLLADGVHLRDHVIEELLEQLVVPAANRSGGLAAV
ncbi:MAG: hypothetical protein JO225_02240 [Candidatus Eremiobacteraeota bacterium]|nr:hypothetical protein [Candidatus Eremiobacteraeota bacterium]